MAFLGTADDSHNWGACTLRRLNAAELAVLRSAGITPTVGPDHEARAKSATAALLAAGLVVPNGEIHCDSAPDIGAYFVFFSRFNDYTFPHNGTSEFVSGDVLGARYYCRLAFGQPGKYKSLYVLAMRNDAAVEQWADVAYRQHYYTGTSPDAATDIQHYVKFMGAFVPTFTAYLKDFDPSACEAVPPPFRAILQRGDYGEDVRDAQEHMASELAAIGAGPDGAWGQKTDAACIAWRREHGLEAVARWDDDCRAMVNGAMPDATMVRLSSLQFGDWRAALDAQTAADSLHDDETDAATALGPSRG